MLTLEYIKNALQDRRPGMVAEATGLHPNTITAIRDGKNTNPTYQVLEALSDYLGGGESSEKTKDS